MIDWLDFLKDTVVALVVVAGFFMTLHAVEWLAGVLAHG